MDTNIRVRESYRGYIMINIEPIHNILIIIFALLVITQMGRIFAPNYYIKQYVSKIKSIPSDNVTRGFSFFWLLLYGALLLFLLGVIKI